MRSSIIDFCKKQLNIKPKNEDLYLLAMSHRSNPIKIGEKRYTNERLEFLGDAVLELVVSEFLYENYPNLPEGVLTPLRARIVCTESLSSVSKEIELGKYIRLSKQEREDHGYEKSHILADTFEALLGAMYIDLGLDTVKKIVRNLLLSEKNIKVLLQQEEYKNAKTRLQEITQKLYKKLPVYRIKQSYGPDHDKHYVVEVLVNDMLCAEGKGKSKQKAEEQAAYKCLEKLKKSGIIVSPKMKIG